MEAAYIYDGYGRRVEKHVTTYMTGTTVFTTPTVFAREYVFDGLDPVYEYDYEGDTVTPTLTSAYVYGNGRMVSMERTEDSARKTYWYHYDGLGSVVALTDESGADVCQWKYDEYGNPLQDCPDLNHYTYTGQEVHRYLFVLCNPVNRYDLAGYFSLKNAFKSFTEPKSLASLAVGLGTAALVIATAPVSAPALLVGAAAVAAGTVAGTVTYDILDAKEKGEKVKVGEVARHCVENVAVNEIKYGGTVAATAVGVPTVLAIGTVQVASNVISGKPWEEDVGTAIVTAKLSEKMFKGIRNWK